MSENQNKEYKSVWKDEYQKWICGFANAQGGTLYIGKDDNGDVIGVKNAKKLLEELSNSLKIGRSISSYTSILHARTTPILPMLFSVAVMSNRGGVAFK
jgi:predicted HTH transcriptional regulator